MSKDDKYETRMSPSAALKLDPNIRKVKKNAIYFVQGQKACAVRELVSLQPPMDQCYKLNATEQVSQWPRL